MYDATHFVDKFLSNTILRQSLKTHIFCKKISDKSIFISQNVSTIRKTKSERLKCYTNNKTKKYALTSNCCRFSYLSAWTNCNKYNNSSSSDDICKRAIAYFRRAGCVKSGLSRASASLLSIGSHFSSNASACRTSVAVSQLMQRRKTTRA